MDEQSLMALQQMQNEAQEERNRRIQAEQNQVATMFNSESNENLIKYQLDIKEELERIEHLLRKHVPYIDSNGNQDFREAKKKVLVSVFKDADGLIYYQEEGDGRIIKIRDSKNKQTLFLYGETTNSGQQLWNIKQKSKVLTFVKYKEIEISDSLFNEHGVKEILNLLAWYLNKTLILSDFDEEEINTRVWQFGRELANFIYNNYEEFGLDTPEKITHYPMVVMNIVNIIEASYHRALFGKERDSLRQARMVSQNENLNSNPTYPQRNKSSFNILKPSTWS